MTNLNNELTADQRDKIEELEKQGFRVNSVKVSMFRLDTQEDGTEKYVWVEVGMLGLANFE